MTRERSAAYRRLVGLLDSHGGDLLPEERDQIRTAADALLFCRSLEADPDARHAVEIAGSLVVRRIVSGCALAAVADQLLVELGGCGPDPESVELAHAA
jgi:hypothetical protein